MSVNPYQSPNVDTTASPELRVDGEFTLPIKTAPSDLVDIAIGIPHAFVVLLVPAAIMFVATGSPTAAVSCVVVVHLAILLFTVWSIRVSEQGIRFVRVLGTPRFLGWREITSVQEASRREVVLQGWFAPRFPPREATIAMSALGHFRVQWRSGCFYFPPKNPQQFREMIDRFCPHATRAHGKPERRIGQRIEFIVPGRRQVATNVVEQRPPSGH